MRPQHSPRRALASIALAATAFTLSPAIAQPVEPTNGPRQIEHGRHAITNATVTTAPGQTIENATVIVRDGVIRAVGQGIDVPEGVRTWDGTGLFVTPAFVEPYFEVDAPAPEAAGAHWNDAVTPQRSALDGGGIAESDAAGLRKQGFAVANLAPTGGIFRGRSAVVALHSGEDAPSHHGSVLDDSLFHVAGFGRAGGYPRSQMGMIALTRQTLADVAWHARAHELALTNPADAERPEDNAALAALIDDAPILWDAGDELEALRMIRHTKEFGRDAIVVGSGTEFRRLDAIREAGVPFVLPLTYPREPLVKSMSDRERVSLRELQTWEQAPTNPWRLDEAGVTFAFTASKLRKGEKFMGNLRKALEHNYTEDKALAALTTTPAEMLGVSHLVGTIETGKLANLIVSDKPIFEKGAKIRDVWVDGVRYEINAAPAPSLEGEWAVDGPGGGITVIFDGKNKVTVKDARHGEDDAKTYKGRNVTLNENRLSYDVDSEISAVEGASTLVDAVIEGDRLHGTIVEPDGTSYPWSATRVPSDEGGDEEGDNEEGDSEEDETDENAEEERDLSVPYDLPTPLGAFGLTTPAFQDSTLFTNATVWTCGPAGVIENGWVLAGSDGTIEYVGEAMDEIDPMIKFVIDCEGKHITPGLIDCHSHTGISGGVNEGTQAVTAEVRIFDVINPDHIGWYRQLAGGITAVNQLHGSANPIGGQNSVVKLRWGCDHPDDMRLDGAVGGIKFALGENVKRAGRGSGRYPATRMGVETLIRDRFVAAREYGQAWDDYNALPDRDKAGAIPPRRDLELEALHEIIEGDRLIHCHSYRQDEILMLCRLAEEFGFTIGTFQHVLEGYKVAEAIRDNAIGGSSFSDWWAYKFEVYDAIPDNGSIMHEVGVVVSFNSDSNELARRMNTEAAKAVKYGGVSEEEALKFVTLNPAKQLKIDDRVGSLEVGKDADIVVWSHHPLSTFAKPEHTMVESRMMFSLARDLELRQAADAERQRIIQKIITPESKGEKKPDAENGDEGEPDEGDGDGPRRGRGPSMLERMTSGALAEELLAREYRWLIENGLDPEIARCGDCGCSTHSLFNVNSANN